MFTGIVETLGFVHDIGRSTLTVRCALSQVKVGDSIAVNGACLTVRRISGSDQRAELEFDYSPETALKTNIGQFVPGSAVNLEQALRVGDRLGGHLMTGHVDGTATIANIVRADNSWIFEFNLGRELLQYLAPKGSVGVDGVSLTVVECRQGSFTVALIPHTMENTTFSGRKAGDVVNIETDILAKYVEGMLHRSSSQSELTEGFLKDHGFIK